jgi:hypothetical protein
MSKSRNQAMASSKQVDDLERRVNQLELLLMKREEITPSESQCLSVDVAIIESKLRRPQSELFDALYPPQENGNTIYDLSRHKITSKCSGYWPEKKNWHGIYLGGCDDENNRRRAITIPMCLMNNLRFFSPQGLENSIQDNEQRYDAMNLCASALIDFTWDELCLNYSAGMDLMYFISQGFVNIALMNLSKSPSVDCLKFVNDRDIKNNFGPYDYVSLRQRRFDYYTFLRCIVEDQNVIFQEGIREFTAFEGEHGLAHDIVNLRANYDQSSDKRIRISVVDRLSIYRVLEKKNFQTDIGIIMRICFGMLLLCDMNTRSFMDDTMPDWKSVLGEFNLLCMAMDVHDMQQTSNEQDADKSDSDIHNKACIDLVSFVKQVVQKRNYLNF